MFISELTVVMKNEIMLF